MMTNHYIDYHIRRVIKSTNDLWKQPDSICHKCHHMEGEMNCLLCFCPKYEDVDCGGHFKILKNGVKDCSGCNIPHEPVFVEEYLRRLL